MPSDTVIVDVQVQVLYFCFPSRSDRVLSSPRLLFRPLRITRSSFTHLLDYISGCQCPCQRLHFPPGPCSNICYESAYKMPAPPNYVFTVFSFVAFFLCLIKLPMQFHAWNVGTHLFLAWIGLQSLFLGINSIIWNHNTLYWAPVWCDITTRFGLGISIAFPAIVLCINRRLYMLASTSINLSKAESKRELIIDLVIGIALPIIVIVLSFLVQPSRYDIVEDYGCILPIRPSWVSVIIISIPPILLELIAAVYGCLCIHAFYNHSKQMKFSAISAHILRLPAVVWRATTLDELSYELNRWVIVWGAFFFFAIFGFTKESRNNYWAMIQSVVQVFVKITGIKNRPTSSTGTGRKADGITFYSSQAGSYL